jgi:tetratricopeptide (TPR) repeat protein
VPHPSPSPARTSWLAAALLVGIVLVSYYNSITGALVLDDAATVTDNASIRQLWPLGPALLPPNDAGVGGRPIANLTFAVNYALGGLDVRGYHVFNLALHCAAALTLFGVVRRTLLRPVWRARYAAAATPLGLAAAAIWAAHPLTTAVVDYVSQRTEALMACSYLLTLYGFIRWTEARETNDGAGGSRWLVFTTLSCALGMASKEVMVTAPLLVLLYDRTFIAGTWKLAWRRHAQVHVALASTWILLASLMLGSRIGDRGIGFGQNVSAWSYLVTETTALTRYLRLAVWPQPLVFDYGWSFAPGLGAALPHALACLALVVGTLIALVRRPVLGFVGGAFLLILAPTSSFVPISQQPIAESRMYLPLAGVVTAGMVGLFALLGRRALLVAACATVAGVAITLHRNADYRTVLGLWQDTVAKTPQNARAHGNLGATLFLAGREIEAVAEFETALRLKPDYAEAHNNLAAWLVRLNRPAEALVHLDAALRSQPDLINAHYNRGNTLMQLGRRPEAIASFETVLRMNPHHARALSDLALIDLEAGRISLAIDRAEAALAVDPKLAVAHHNLANALSTSGRFREAIPHYETALRLDPKFAKAEHNLAVALLRSGDTRGAIEHFEAALRLRPDYPEAKKNLEAVRAQLR